MEEIEAVPLMDGMIWGDSIVVYLMMLNEAENRSEMQRRRGCNYLLSFVSCAYNIPFLMYWFADALSEERAVLIRNNQLFLG